MKCDDTSLSQLLDVLGNENRRRIIALLETRSCFVTEISERLSISPKAVIDHLQVLEQALIINHQIGSNRRKYYHISHELDIAIQKLPKEHRIVPADPSPEYQYRDGMHHLHQLCKVRKYLSDELQKVDKEIDTQLEQILTFGSRADISQDEIMISAALAHGAQTIKDVKDLCPFHQEKVEEVLFLLVEQGLVTRDKNQYALRDV
jgi:ArsR family transcriptional regulator